MGLYVFYRRGLCMQILMKMAFLELLNGYSDSWEEMIGDEKGNYDYLMYRRYGI